MGKYTKKPTITITQKSLYKRFCSICKKVSVNWVCCGKRTRRLNMEQNKPIMKGE